MSFETIYPLIIVLIGVIVVIGMIVALRVNAFIALITAAVLVSILSGGAPSEMIRRVAGAFGDTGKRGLRNTEPVNAIHGRIDQLLFAKFTLALAITAGEVFFGYRCCQDL